MKLIVFDCDSTLSAIEGIDELARVCGPATFEEIEALTNAAMNGDVPIDEIFSRRLEIIKPSLATCKQVGELYIEQIEPTALATFEHLRAEGWEIVIVSGGFTQVIEPLAKHLDVKRIEAVPLKFHEDGSYAGYGHLSPPNTQWWQNLRSSRSSKASFIRTTWSWLEMASQTLKPNPLSTPSLALGATLPEKKVRSESDHFVFSLEEIPAIISAD